MNDEHFEEWCAWRGVCPDCGHEDCECEEDARLEAEAATSGQYDVSSYDYHQPWEQA